MKKLWCWLRWSGEHDYGPPAYTTNGGVEHEVLTCRCCGHESDGWRRME